MSEETKPIVACYESFAKFDISVGRAVEVELETRTRKPGSLGRWIVNGPTHAGPFPISVIN